MNLAVFPTERSVPIMGFSAMFNRHYGLAPDSIFGLIDFLDMIEDQWSYKRPHSAFIHADMAFVAGYATRDSRVSKQT